MPTYEYRCAKGHTFEQVQRMTEDPVGLCPECGAAAERLMSAGVGLLFKGSGFYITDYRSDSYKKAAAADSSEKSGTKKSDSGSDKPASGGSDKPAAGGSDKPAAGGSDKPAAGGSDKPASSASDKPAAGGSSSPAE